MSKFASQGMSVGHGGHLSVMWVLFAKSVCMWLQSLPKLFCSALWWNFLHKVCKYFPLARFGTTYFCNQTVIQSNLCLHMRTIAPTPYTWHRSQICRVPRKIVKRKFTGCSAWRALVGLSFPMLASAYFVVWLEIRMSIIAYWNASQAYDALAICTREACAASFFSYMTKICATKESFIHWASLVLSTEPGTVEYTGVW